MRWAKQIVGPVCLGALMFSAEGWAACPATPADTATHASEAERAFANMDLGRFTAASSELREEVGCLVAAPSPHEAALIHRAEALAWFQAGDREKTVGALRAMLAAEPDMLLSDEVEPPHGVVASRLFEAMARAPSPTVPTGLPAGLVAVVDGWPSPTLPTDRPALVVVQSETDQHPLWSGLTGGAPLPPLPYAAVVADWSPGLAPEPSVSALAAPAEGRAQRRVGAALLVSAGGSAVAAGVLWGLFVPARDEVNDVARRIAAGESPDEIGLSGGEVQAMEDNATALGRGAQVTAGAALGLGVAGVVLRW